MLDAFTNAAWLLSLATGLLAAGVAVYRLQWDGSQKAKTFVQLQSVIVFTIFCIYIAELNWGKSNRYDQLGLVCSSLGACLAVVLLPRFANCWKTLRFFPEAQRFFLFSGSLLFFHYLVTGIYYFATAFQNGLEYFDGHRVLPAFILHILLAGGFFYTLVSIFALRPDSRIPQSERNLLKLLAWVTTIVFPFIVVIDFLRWLIPPLWRLYREERVFLLPGYIVFVNIILLLVYLQRPATNRGNGERIADNLFAALSAREAQVAGLLAKGKSYQEVASALFIEVSTVQSHVKRIYGKLGVKTKMELRDVLSTMQNEPESSS